MKNSLSLILITTILLVFTLGCGLIGQTDAPSNAKEPTLTDQAVDATVGVKKIGIPECDEVVDVLNAEMNNPEDNFITKAAKATVLNTIKDQFMTAIEDNKTDKVALAKTCREFKTNLDKYKAESNTAK